MSALRRVIHGMQLASDISPESTTCDESACPSPLSERHQVVSQPVIRTSIIDRTLQMGSWAIAKVDEVLTLEQMVDYRNFEDFIVCISTFCTDIETYCAHK